MEILTVIIELPVWLVIAICLAGVVVGMFFLTLAIMLLGHSTEKKVAKSADPVATKPGHMSPNLVLSPEVAFGAASIKVSPQAMPASSVPASSWSPSSVPVAPRPSPQPAPAPVVSSALLPFKQHYWYYVSGVPGRFVTLREALTASGVNVPADKMLDWKKLTADTRAKIKRVKVGDELPVPEQVVIPKEVKAVPQKEPEVKTASIGKSDTGSRVKPIGNGAFVTFKKKST